MLCRRSAVPVACGSRSRPVFQEQAHRRRLRIFKSNRHPSSPSTNSSAPALFTRARAAGTHSSVASGRPYFSTCPTDPPTSQPETFPPARRIEDRVARRPVLAQPPLRLPEERSPRMLPYSELRLPNQASMPAEHLLPRSSMAREAPWERAVSWSRMPDGGSSDSVLSPSFHWNLCPPRCRSIHLREVAAHPRQDQVRAPIRHPVFRNQPRSAWCHRA